MCKWKLCFMLGKRKICICIPVLIPKWKPPKDWTAGDPEPFPWKWVIDAKIRTEVVRDLQILATIDSLASQLSKGTRSSVQEVVMRAAKSQKLPTDVQLDIGGH